MAPMKVRMNTTNPGGRIGVGSDVRLNQSRKRPAQNSFLGAAGKNKSILHGKIFKRNSGHNLRKNNVALAKALNASKQKNVELTSLVMQYRERAHTAERLAQKFQLLKQDLGVLLNQYNDVSSIQETCDSSQERVLRISLPPRTENECNSGVKEARTQLVNPMVQGMSISKVKVLLERINDVPRAQGHPWPASDASSGSIHRRSLQESANPPAETSLQESRSPGDEDPTMDLTMVHLGASGEPFANSQRVPSLTLQRLSLQEIQRTTTATYMTESLAEMSSTNQSPHDQSGAVRLAQSMFPSEGDCMESRQCAHEVVDEECGSLCGIPQEGEERAQQLSVENPLEGTSWMYDTNRLSRRIRVTNRRTLHQKSPKLESVKRRYSVKNLAAKDNFVLPTYKDFSPPTTDERALQDMSLTLCIPQPAMVPRVILETVKMPPTEPCGDAVDLVVPAANEDSALPDIQIKVGRKSPTVTVTRLFDADIFRLSSTGVNRSASDDVSPGASAPLQDDVPVAHLSGAGDTLTIADAEGPCEQHCSAVADAVNTAVDDVSEVSRRKVSDTAKVVLTRVDNETEVVKPSEKRRTRRTVKTKSMEAPVLRLPSRRAKNVEPGAFKEPSLQRKLRW